MSAEACKWEGGHQRDVLLSIDPKLAEEFPFGCDAIEGVAEALVTARKDLDEWKKTCEEIEQARDQMGRERDALAVMVGEMREALNAVMQGESVRCMPMVLEALALDLTKAAKIAEARKKLADLVRGYNCCWGGDTERTPEAWALITEIFGDTRKS